MNWRTDCLEQPCETLIKMTIKTASSYCCSIFCAIAIIVSLATNYWIEFGDESLNHHGGLLEICYENEEHGPFCSRFSELSMPRLMVIGLYIIALLLTLVAFIFVTVYCVTGKYYFPIGRVVTCFLGSAVAVGVALIQYAVTYKDVDQEKWLWFSFSWSYGLGWSMFGMYIVTVVLLFADK